MPTKNAAVLSYESQSKAVTSTAADAAIALDQGRARTVVLHHVSGTSPVYFRMDGTPAVAAAAGTLCLPAGTSRELDIYGSGGSFNISLISPGSCTVHIEVFK